MTMSPRAPSAAASGGFRIQQRQGQRGGLASSLRPVVLDPTTPKRAVAFTRPAVIFL